MTADWQAERSRLRIDLQNALREVQMLQERMRGYTRERAIVRSAKPMSKPEAAQQVAMLRLDLEAARETIDYLSAALASQGGSALLGDPP